MHCQNWLTVIIVINLFLLWSILAISCNTEKTSSLSKKENQFIKEYLDKYCLEQCYLRDLTGTRVGNINSSIDTTYVHVKHVFENFTSDFRLQKGESFIYIISDNSKNEPSKILATKISRHFLNEDMLDSLGNLYPIVSDFDIVSLTNQGSVNDHLIHEKNFNALQLDEIIKNSFNHAIICDFLDGNEVYDTIDISFYKSSFSAQSYLQDLDITCPRHIKMDDNSVMKLKLVIRSFANNRLIKIYFQADHTGVYYSSHHAFEYYFLYLNDENGLQMIWDSYSGPI